MRWSCDEKADQKTSRKIMFAHLLGNRKRGMPRLHYRDELDKDARTRLRNWQMVTPDLDDWKGFFGEAKTQMSCGDDDDYDEMTNN